jgi:serine/threonine-protein kinase
MKIKTPIITLLVGVALAVVLLISSMSAVSGKKAALAAASASAAAAAPAVTTSAAASTAAASGSQSASATASASASASGSGFVIPPHANYDGEVQGNKGAVALVVHDTFAIAYFCNGSTIEAWFSGTPDNGKLNLTGKGDSAGSTLTANYALGHARGTVVVNGVSYVFSIIAVHSPSGLFQSIATVRGATVKAGWIVLANGTEVGSLNPNDSAANAVSQAAPKLDLSTLTADDGGTTISAVPIDGETGSGF